MKITKAWIEKWKPCKDSIRWIKEQDTKDVFKLINRLRKSNIEDTDDWLFWAIPRLLKTRENRARLAVYCAELVLPMFERKYPNDKRPRQAIQATKNWINSPTEKNRAIARTAKVAALAVGDVTVGIPGIVAWITAWAAEVVESDIEAIIVKSVTGTARNSADVVKDKGSIVKIIDYGIELLKLES